MATATVYIGEVFVNPEVRTIFLPELEKVLKKVSAYKVSSQIGNTNLVKPNIFILLEDFGNMSLESVGELMEAARKLTRQHFGFGDPQIEIEFSGKITDMTTT